MPGLGEAMNPWPRSSPDLPAAATANCPCVNQCRVRRTGATGQRTQRQTGNWRLSLSFFLPFLAARSLFVKNQMYQNLGSTPVKPMTTAAREQQRRGGVSQACPDLALPCDRGRPATGTDNSAVAVSCPISWRRLHLLSLAFTLHLIMAIVAIQGGGGGGRCGGGGSFPPLRAALKRPSQPISGHTRTRVSSVTFRVTILHCVCRQWHHQHE